MARGTMKSGSRGGMGTHLLSNTVSTTSTGGLVLGATELLLVGEDLGTGLLCLGLVDVLHEDTLVLEDVTLGLHVEQVVAESQ